MYGNIGNVNETPANLVCGIHEITVLKAEVVAPTSTMANGALDITFVTRSGAQHRHRIFPFSFRDGVAKRDGGIQTEKEQMDIYLSKIKHLCTKAYAGTDKEFDAALSSATDFKSFATILAGLLNTSKDWFRCKFIDNNGYPKIPQFTGGVAEKLTTNPSMLRFDPIKDGPKQAASESTEEQASLPF